ncbi:phage protein [Xanthobacter flavus]|uniref:phage protein n=1 Tax=Xanthobacter flavus TaxID=281 RepID=UPI0037282224
MTQQWIRDVRLLVGNGAEALNVSDLRIRFVVQQSTTPAPGQADITITNLSNATANRIQKEYDRIVLQAGYRDGGASTIFMGEIVQKRGPGRENSTDTYFNILAKEGQKGYSNAFISKTLASGHTFRDQVDACLDVLKEYGITAGYIADLGSTKMPRGRAMFGMVREQLRTICASTNATWWVEGTKLNITKNTQALPGDPIVLNSATGMIGMPVQTIDGVEVRCLLNPKIKHGGLIKIDEASIQRAKYVLDTKDSYMADVETLDKQIAADGVYQVLFRTHYGDTRGNEYYTDLICIPAQGGVITKRIAQRMVPIENN